MARKEPEAGSVLLDDSEHALVGQYRLQEWGLPLGGEKGASTAGPSSDGYPARTAANAVSATPIRGRGGGKGRNGRAVAVGKSNAHGRFSPAADGPLRLRPVLRSQHGSTRTSSARTNTVEAAAGKRSSSDTEERIEASACDVLPGVPIRPGADDGDSECARESGECTPRSTELELGECTAASVSPVVKSFDNLPDLEDMPTTNPEDSKDVNITDSALFDSAKVDTKLFDSLDPKTWAQLTPESQATLDVVTRLSQLLKERALECPSPLRERQPSKITSSVSETDIRVKEVEQEISGLLQERDALRKICFEVIRVASTVKCQCRELAADVSVADLVVMSMRGLEQIEDELSDKRHRKLTDAAIGVATSGGARLTSVPDVQNGNRASRASVGAPRTSLASRSPVLATRNTLPASLSMTSLPAPVPIMRRYSIHGSPPDTGPPVAIPVHAASAVPTAKVVPTSSFRPTSPNSTQRSPQPQRCRVAPAMVPATSGVVANQSSHVPPARTTSSPMRPPAPATPTRVTRQTSPVRLDHRCPSSEERPRGLNSRPKCWRLRWVLEDDVSL
eukprot:TRINITY_DN6272_c1_g3_i1.p1 TRINITY_DN6272_c1_g3~~TRINITY_DN6272_c1_g3_i1.p1  ORF type:complete len:574 (-),score=48.45 TRINITY_DN6272_c1_g3_i1:338-2029(-)